MIGFTLIQSRFKMSIKIDAWPSSLRLTPGHITLSEKSKKITLVDFDKDLKNYLEKINREMIITGKIGDGMSYRNIRLARLIDNQEKLQSQ